MIDIAVAVHHHSQEYGNDSDGIFSNLEVAMKHIASKYGDYQIEEWIDGTIYFRPRNGEYFKGGPLINSVSVHSLKKERNDNATD